MKPLKDMIGVRIGRLVVVSRAENGKQGGARWNCVCDCGGTTTQPGPYLRKEIVRSCGCLRRETSREVGLKRRTHGQAVAETAEYKAWASALRRCHNPKHKQWALYGGRGIHVADEWRKDFEAFYAYVGPRPSPNHSLDRIDPDKGYEPGNVRWADWFVQGNNRRNNHIVTVDGVDMTLAEAIRLKGQKSSRVRQRLAMGWTVERALNENSRAKAFGESG